MKVHAIKCSQCKDIIYSRARHDYHSCSCGDISIDGGFDYSRVIFKNEPPKSVEVEVNATKQELYNDWNHYKNKFGLIKGD